jgi:hypothetical protein
VSKNISGECVSDLLDVGLEVSKNHAILHTPADLLPRIEPLAACRHEAGRSHSSLRALWNSEAASVV